MITVDDVMEVAREEFEEDILALVEWGGKCG